MSTQNNLLGGFVATNSKTGKIEDCYCMTRFRGTNLTAGGFAGENKGTIRTSYCEHSSRGLSGGFMGAHSSFSNSCYFIHNLKDNTPKLHKLWDENHGLSASQIQSDSDAAKLGFDTKNVWKYTGRKPHLQFQDSHWFYRDAFLSHPSKKIITIKDAKNLYLFAEMVNQGDPRFLTAKVRLEADIDLKGKVFLPIGAERKNAFSGVFDGNGHTIKNFVIKGDEIHRKGFFGYLKGEVYNLTIDCEVRGNGYIGGIAAVNEGTIGCCGVIIVFNCQGSDQIIGGFVSINSGHIFQCYAAGRVRTRKIPLLPLLLLLSSVSVLGMTAFAALPAAREHNNIYNAVASDPGQEKIENPQQNLPSEETEETQTTESKGSTLAFSFYQSIDILLSSGECVIAFANPSTSDNRIQIELQLTDVTAVAAMGGTGRTPELQAYYDASEDYDPTVERVSIAESGAIDPGYQLKTLPLNEFAKQNLKPGTYEGFVSLTPYDAKTNEKSVLTTDMPVTIVVK